MSQAEQKSFREMRRTGWGMGLYRDRARGWIGGVCAGLSHHWGVAPWLVRLGAFALLLFTNWLAFWAYLAAWMFLLAPRPNRWEQGSTESAVLDYDEDQHVYRKRSVFRYADAPSSRLKKARERLDDAMVRVEIMERYMTSRRYDLNREFSKL